MALSKYVVVHGGIKIPHTLPGSDKVRVDHVYEAPRGKPPTVIEVDDALAIHHLDVLEPIALFEAKAKARSEGDKLVEEARAKAEAEIAKVKASVLELHESHRAKLATAVTQKAKG